MNWQSAVERTVTGLGYDLVDAEKGAGGVLRVYIDHPPGAQASITVDDCEKVTRQLQHVLEVEGCTYERLEVSSPGLDRPLRKPADYARFVGAQVELTLKQPLGGRKKFRGELQARGAEGWRLVLVDGPGADRKRARKAPQVTEATPGGRRALDFSLDEIREAHLVPVLDFRGRRHAAAPAAADEGGRAQDGADGGRIQ
jgi:ribosome maturation factor RimP